MIKENRVYVNAEQLADRFGYDVVIGDESILIKCLETPVMPRTFVIFDFNDTKVTKMLYSSFCDTFLHPLQCPAYFHSEESRLNPDYTDQPDTEELF